MTLSNINIKQLMEHRVHYGHVVHRWNPKMQGYIYGVRDNMHILNLDKTKPLLRQALQAIEKVVSNGGKILMVGTKKQARTLVQEAADECAQFYVNHRWLGGTLTNWSTIKKSIETMKTLEHRLETNVSGLTKKEILNLQRKYDKLHRSLGGIKDMRDVPDMLFVIDTNENEIAIKEGQKINIPIVAIVDSNSNPENITYPVPGNDDAIGALSLYCDLFTDAVLSGTRKLLDKGVKDEDKEETQNLDAISTSDSDFKEEIAEEESNEGLLTTPSDSTESSISSSMSTIT